MSGFWWLSLGVLLGWLIELAIDYQYWRRQARATQDAIAQKGKALERLNQDVISRERSVAVREQETAALQGSLNARDAELLAQAKRVDERAGALDRTQKAQESRRVELEKLSTTLMERDRDSTARQQKVRQDEQQAAARQARIAEAEVDIARRVAAVANREASASGWDARLSEREHQVQRRESVIDRRSDELAAMSHELESLRSIVARTYRDEQGADRLDALPGIDASTATLLREADIVTFERLSETPLGELTRILERAGTRRQLVNPLDWAEQASMVVSRRFVALDRLTNPDGSRAVADAEATPRTQDASRIGPDRKSPSLPDGVAGGDSNGGSSRGRQGDSPSDAADRDALPEFRSVSGPRATTAAVATAPGLKVDVSSARALEPSLEAPDRKGERAVVDHAVAEADGDGEKGRGQ